MNFLKFLLLNLLAITLQQSNFVFGAEPNSIDSKQIYTQAVQDDPNSQGPYLLVKGKYKSDDFVEQQFSFHFYGIPTEFANVLKRPNVLSFIRFNDVDYLFEKNAKLPNTQIWNVLVVTCDHNVPVLINLKSLVENYFYTLNPETGKWGNKAINALKRFENGDNGYRLVLENDLDQNDAKFLDYFSDECYLISKDVCSKHTDENISIDEPSLDLVVKHPASAPSELEIIPEEEPQLSSENLARLKDLLTKNEIYYIVKILRTRLIKFYNFSANKIFSLGKNEEYENWIEDKDDELVEVIQSLDELIIEFYTSDDVEKWLDLLSKFPEKFIAVSNVVDKMYEKAHELLDDEEKKVFEHNKLMYKSGNYSYLLTHLNMLIESFGEEYQDAKFDNNLKDFKKQREEAAINARKLVDNNDEEDRIKTLKEIRKNVEKASSKVIKVVESVVKERKNKNIDVKDNYVSEIKEFIDKAIDISNSIVPGLISILLPFAILMFV